MLKMYTTTWCSDCTITKKMLAKLEIPFQEINIEEHPDAAEHVMRINDGRRSVPTLEYGEHAASLSNFNRAKLEAFLTQTNLKTSKALGARS
jgi:mycoredoxin